MPFRFRGFSLALAVFAAAIALSAQSGQVVAMPPGTFFPAGAPVSGPPATGSGLMLGRVVDGSTGKPIQGVTVSVSMPQAAPVSAPGAAPVPVFRPQSVITGGDGMFVFRDLPSGQFTVFGTLAGYLALSAGTNGSPASSQTVSLDAGAKINDVELRLWKSGAVTGQVLDEQSEAVEGITINLLRIDMLGGRRNFAVQQTTTTDDRGVYRFARLPPGDYALCALFSRHIAPIAAGLAQASGSAATQQTLSGSGARSPSGSGYRVGDLMLISSSAERNVDPAPDENGRLSVFSDACFSSASALQGAQPVRVDSGQERSQINMVLRIVPSARILGTLIGPANRISGMAVHLYPAASDDSTMAGAIEAAQTVTDPNGGFGFIGVPAGSYVLRVVYAPFQDVGIPPEVVSQILAQGGSIPDMVMPRSAAQLPTEPTLWATASIVMGDTDVTGVVLALREGARVSGQIVFEGGKDRPVSDRMAMAWMSFDPAGGPSLDAYPQPRGQFAGDGKFATTGVVPGRYLLHLFSAFPGWTLKSILADGRDVSDEPLEVSGSDVGGVIVTMTDRPTELSGLVRDAGGAADGRASVLVFPSDRARWSQVGGGRRTGNTSVSRQGAFSVSGLPPGDYFVVAVGSPPGTNWLDPAMLDTLARVASRVTLREGERRMMDLVATVIR